MIASAVPGPGVPWWLGDLPIAILVLLLVCVNFAGDTLDDALNPRRSHR